MPYKSSTPRKPSDTYCAGVWITREDFLAADAPRIAKMRRIKLREFVPKQFLDKVLAMPWEERRLKLHFLRSILLDMV